MAAVRAPPLLLLLLLLHSSAANEDLEAPSTGDGGGPEMCRNPSKGRSSLTLNPSQAWYHRGARVQVTCSHKYQPSTPEIECTQMDESSGSAWDVTPICIKRCKKPTTGGSPFTLSPSQPWYDRGQRVQVSCSAEYQPSPSEIECRQKGHSSASEWDVAPTCIQRCKNPTTEGSTPTLSPSREWYVRGDRVRVSCSEEYRPPVPEVECRAKDRSSASEWDVTPTCIRRCTNPSTGGSRLTLAPPKEWYDPGDRVQVTCSEGYQASPSSMQCRLWPWSSASEWDERPSCIQRCQKPAAGGLTLELSPSQEWYDRGDWVHVTCAAGYQSLISAMLCREKDQSSASEWDETLTCIQIKQTNLDVSSSSIFLTLTCDNEDCQSFWETSASCYQNSCCENRCPSHVIDHKCTIDAHNNQINETAITCAGLLPFTEYIVAVYGTRRQPYPERYVLLYNVTVTTNETVPDAPEIEWFNATTKTIKWKKLSECNGTIHKYQLNITACSDFNKTFQETEFVTVNSSVTEYTVGINVTTFTARIQGLTFAGLGKVLTRTFSTKISGPSNEDQQPVAQEESLESLELSMSSMDEAILSREENLRGCPNQVPSSTSRGTIRPHPPVIEEKQALHFDMYIHRNQGKNVQEMKKGIEALSNTIKRVLRCLSPNRNLNESVKDSHLWLHDIDECLANFAGHLDVHLNRQGPAESLKDINDTLQSIQKSVQTFQEELEKKMDSLLGVMNVLNQNIIQFINSQQTLARDLTTAFRRFTDVLEDMQPFSSTTSLSSIEATRPLPTSSKNIVEQEKGSEDVE